MTTPKPYHAPKTSVTFAKPAVGPKIYLSKGPSGWPEQFPRKLADKALDDFLAPLATDDVLRTFRVAMQLEARDETWSDVAAYLAKITDTTEKSITGNVGVAFWGRYLLAKRNEGTN